MDRTEWIGRLELLHTNLRRGMSLTPEDEAWYRRARARFLATAVDAQNGVVVGNERPRQAVRLERAVQIRLGGPGWSRQVMTTDLAVGGFAVHTDTPIDRERLAWADVDVPGETLRFPVRLVATTMSGGQVRVSFAFKNPEPAHVAALEDFILDQLLPSIVFWDGVLDRIRD